jgi:flavin reductase (DIM6/NTAB) family NADH-FMN oxidoreductase RutF
MSTNTVHIDAREFRNTVGQFVTGVTVIAANIDGDVKGMTANAFTSLSLDPPLVLFCVAKKAHLGQSIHKASGFSVNILRQDQQNLSTYFAGGWKEPEPPPFTFEPWHGGPILVGSGAAIGCAIEKIHDGGDHHIVVGRVLALYKCEPPWAPLVFSAGKYVALEEPSEPL